MVLDSSLTGMVGGTCLLCKFFLQLQTNIVHPLLLFQFATCCLRFHLATQTFHIPTTPQQGNECNDNDIERQCPARAPKSRADGYLHGCLFVANGAVVIEHADMQGVRAGTQRVIRDIRVALCRLYPVLIKALQHIDKTLLIIDMTAITGQLNGKLVTEAQRDIPADVERLVENDAAVNLFADGHVHIKQLQAAENRVLLATRTGKTLGIDDVQAVLATDKQQSAARQQRRALIVGAPLQAVATGVAAHGKLPSAVFLPFQNNLRDTMVGDHPHGMVLVFHNRAHAGPHQSAGHIQQIDTLRVRVVNSSVRDYPP